MPAIILYSTVYEPSLWVANPQQSPPTELNRLIHIYFKWVPSVGVGWMSDVLRPHNVCVYMTLQFSAGQGSEALMTLPHWRVFALVIAAWGQ